MGGDGGNGGNGNDGFSDVMSSPAVRGAGLGMSVGGLTGVGAVPGAALGGLAGLAMGGGLPGLEPSPGEIEAGTGNVAQVAGSPGVSDGPPGGGSENTIGGNMAQNSLTAQIAQMQQQIDQLEGGGFPSYQMDGGNLTDPRYAMYKDAAEQQYQTAQDALMSMLPTGGGLESALGDLETEKASQITQGVGSLYQDALDKAYGRELAEMGANVTLTGQKRQAEAIEEAQQSQMFSQLGYGLASMSGK